MREYTESRNDSAKTSSVGFRLGRTIEANAAYANGARQATSNEFIEIYGGAKS